MQRLLLHAQISTGEAVWLCMRQEEEQAGSKPCEERIHCVCSVTDDTAGCRGL